MILILENDRIIELSVRRALGNEAKNVKFAHTIESANRIIRRHDISHIVSRDEIFPGLRVFTQIPYLKEVNGNYFLEQPKLSYHEMPFLAEEVKNLVKSLIAGRKFVNQ